MSNLPKVVCLITLCLLSWSGVLLQSVLQDALIAALRYVQNAYKGSSILKTYDPALSAEITVPHAIFPILKNAISALAVPI